MSYTTLRYIGLGRYVWERRGDEANRKEGGKKGKREKGRWSERKEGGRKGRAIVIHSYTPQLGFLLTLSGDEAQGKDLQFNELNMELKVSF
jgi:hypothetical protein